MKKNIPIHVSQSAQLAALLEVSGTPKPGNVHRTQNFPDMRYEHFLAGSIAIGPVMQKAAEKGIKLGKNKIKPSEINLGEDVKKAVERVENSHKAGNTHLGIILLFTPLAIAAGKILTKHETLESKVLRKNFDQIMKNTTYKDSINVYDAIQSAIGLKQENKDQNSWLGNANHTKLSVTNPNTRKKLADEKISLYDWMEASAKWDGIGRELTTKMEASFETGYPTLIEVFEETGNINTAVVHAFLKILSEYPDTFIARKIGLEKTTNIKQAVEIGWKKAEQVSNQAKSVLEMGGLTTEEGKTKLEKFDKKLQKSNGKLNPGTTADLTAASINIALLTGLKY